MYILLYICITYVYITYVYITFRTKSKNLNLETKF